MLKWVFNVSFKGSASLIGSHFQFAPGRRCSERFSAVTLNMCTSCIFISLSPSVGILPEGVGM